MFQYIIRRKKPSTPYTHGSTITVSIQWSTRKWLRQTFKIFISTSELPRSEFRGLYLPVLPYRSNEKLNFPLCSSCTETERQSPCYCSDEDRVINTFFFFFCHRRINFCLDLISFCPFTCWFSYRHQFNFCHHWFIFFFFFFFGPDRLSFCHHLFNFCQDLINFVISVLIFVKNRNISV